MDKKYDVYVASPFFNEYQLDVVQKIENMLGENDVEFFSPRLAGIVGKDSTSEEMGDIFQKDIDAIESSRYMFAVTDGKDMGTLFECGYAAANKVPIIYIALTLGDNNFNLMLAKTACRVVTSLEELESICKEQTDGVLDITPVEYKGNVE